jgi:dihydroorotate dehydrogenase electron transfer subunit
MPVDVSAPVVYNRQLSPDYNVLALEAPEIAATTRPGQFVMVKPVPGLEPLLRRPFSVFEVLRDHDGRPTGISLLNKRVGTTTAQLHAVRRGETVPCLGPLGRPFSVAAPGTEAWMVAGGVGLAPFATLAEVLRARGVRTTLFYGGRSASDLFCMDLFERLGVDVVLSTEDGSRGARGFVTRPLEIALTAAATPVSLFACGPEPMLAAVASLASRFGRHCEVSVERTMGCGMGGCYSCVVPVKDNGRRHFVRSCLYGPVFDAARLVWE